MQFLLLIYFFVQGYKYEPSISILYFRKYVCFYKVQLMLQNTRSFKLKASPTCSLEANVNNSCSNFNERFANINFSVYNIVTIKKGRIRL